MVDTSPNETLGIGELCLGVCFRVQGLRLLVEVLCVATPTMLIAFTCY